MRKLVLREAEPEKHEVLHLELEDWGKDSVMLAVFSNGEKVRAPYIAQFSLRDGKIRVSLPGCVNSQYVVTDTGGRADVRREF
jgi:hypothetical protein